MVSNFIHTGRFVGPVTLLLGDKDKRNTSTLGLSVINPCINSGFASTLTPRMFTYLYSRVWNLPLVCVVSPHNYR